MSTLEIEGDGYIRFGSELVGRVSPNLSIAARRTLEDYVHFEHPQAVNRLVEQLNDEAEARLDKKPSPSEVKEKFLNQLKRTARRGDLLTIEEITNAFDEAIAETE